ncbi:HK97 family phage prohead protease [Agrobacterium tumefaciens]|uniref:HK97 family phage prohead protease n=1 Tax=Agrobacterium tumefaciens TaxID=358 RepID=A0A4D7YFH6_AGRTU|nr:HK97 family phage prohead protease [Agrobacterium tumefaciens]QCL92896.1 HK97 family phage prohead protease [Agrobacterium tumefaciens]
MAVDSISGYAISWNRPALIGGLFNEQFGRGAFDEALREYPDVAALWAHDSSRPIASTTNGTLLLRSDRIGLWYSLTPDPSSPTGKQALADVRSQLVKSVSVGFNALEERWDDRPDVPMRTVTAARLHELSLVLWPAYGGDITSAAINSSAERARAKMRARGI